MSGLQVLQEEIARHLACGDCDRPVLDRFPIGGGQC
jgi:hypothetical protein